MNENSQVPDIQPLPRINRNPKKHYEEELVALSILGHFDVEANVAALEANNGNAEAAHEALKQRFGRWNNRNTPPTTGAPQFGYKNFGNPINMPETSFDEHRQEWHFDGLMMPRSAHLDMHSYQQPPPAVKMGHGHTSPQMGHGIDVANLPNVPGMERPGSKHRTTPASPIGNRSPHSPGAQPITKQEKGNIPTASLPGPANQPPRPLSRISPLPVELTPIPQTRSNSGSLQNAPPGPVPPLPATTPTQSGPQAQPAHQPTWGGGMPAPQMMQGTDDYRFMPIDRQGMQQAHPPPAENILNAALHNDRQAPVWYANSGIPHQSTDRIFDPSSAIPSVGLQPLAPSHKKRKRMPASEESNYTGHPSWAQAQQAMRGPPQALRGDANTPPAIRKIREQQLREGNGSNCNSCGPMGMMVAGHNNSRVAGLNYTPPPTMAISPHRNESPGQDGPSTPERSHARKIAAQRRYREKKRLELNRLKENELELAKLRQQMEDLKPFETVAAVERARVEAGKRARQWVYVETWPECNIVSASRCHEALGYSLLGRHCWDYKRFPGIKRENTETLKRHWNTTVARGGYPLYDFLDKQFFERLHYRDNKPQWRWSQVVAYRLNGPNQVPCLLQCLETDVHDAVMFGRTHGITEYLKAQGGTPDGTTKSAFHWLLNSNGAYTYQCYVSAEVLQAAKQEGQSPKAAMKQEQHTTAAGDGQPSPKGKQPAAATAVVSNVSEQSRRELGWDMTKMAADDKQPGRGVPILCGKDNKLSEIIAKGRTQWPTYYKRHVHKEDPLKQDMEGAAMARTIIVEAWAVASKETRPAGHPASDGGMYVEILERSLGSDELKNLFREDLKDELKNASNEISSAILDS